MVALVKCVFILCAAVAASGLGDNDVVFHLFTRSRYFDAVASAMSTRDHSACNNVEISGSSKQKIIPEDIPQNPSLSQPLVPAPGPIMASTFSPFRPTVITIHSNGDSVTGNFNAFVVPAHLGAQDVNLLAIDWSLVSGMYTQGLSNSVAVAERIALFINLLSSAFNYGPNNFRIVGVGLGGHIAGISAERVNGVIPHVIAIDPSFVGWTHHPDILKRGQAAVVEVLHTSAGILGYDYPLGDLDFYPNGGSYQTSCGADPSCSHILGYIFYAESISPEGGSRFVGTACESYDDAIAQTCSGEKGVVFGGLENKSGQSGIFSFQTNWQQPFAQG